MIAPFIDDVPFIDDCQFVDDSPFIDDGQFIDGGPRQGVVHLVTTYKNNDRKHLLGKEHKRAVDLIKHC